MSYDVKFSDGENEYGFVCAWGNTQNPLTVEVARPTLSGAVVGATASSPYTVRDLDADQITSFTSFHKGAGQASYDAEDSSENKFYSSDAIDISARGQFGLGPYVGSDETKTLIGSVAIEGLGYLWCNFQNNGSATCNALYWYDGTWHAVVWTGTDPTQNVKALACDGEYVYAAMGTDGIWRGKIATGTATFALWTDDNTCDYITAMHYCGGSLYVSQDGYSTTSVVGTALGARPAAADDFIQVSGNAVISPNCTTIGLVSSGSYVFWGVTGGAQTRVLRIQYVDGTNDTFEQYGEPPSGFIGTCMWAYLGTVYVGGYWQYGTANYGRGSVYAFSNAGANILTHIGEMPTSTNEGDDKTNLIKGMTAYDRFLYITTKTRIWRWDIVNGGYSHYADLPDIDAIPVPTVTWTTYAASALPNLATPAWTEVASGAHEHTISGGVLTTGSTGTHLAYTLNLTGGDALSPTTGYTVQYTTGNMNAAYGNRLYVNDGTYSFLLKCVYYSSTKFALRLCDPADETSYSFLGTFAKNAVHTIRVAFPCSGPYVGVYVDGTKVGSVYAYTTTGGATLNFSVKHSAAHMNQSWARWDEIKWTNDGAYAPGEETSGSIDAHSIVCLDSFVYVPSQGSWGSVPGSGGCLTTIDPAYYATGWGNLMLSRTSRLMPSIDKRFYSIEVAHSALTEGQAIDCTAEVDGISWGAVSNVTAGTTNSSFELDEVGRMIWAKLWIMSANVDSEGRVTDTPTVRGVSIRYNPVGSERHTYVFDTRDRVEDAGRLWDGDPETYIAFLLASARQRSKLAVTSRVDDYDGIIESVRFVESPSSAIQASPYQGLVEVVVREMNA